MDVRTAIIHRPELFERGFIGIVGEIGENILRYIWCTELRKQFDLDSGETYETRGDLEKCMGGIRTRANRGNP